MRAKWKLPANDRSKQAQRQTEREKKTESEWVRAMLKGRLEDSEGLDEKKDGSAGSAEKVQKEQGKQLYARLSITL